jgi:hypothetical protein
MTSIPFIPQELVNCILLIPCPQQPHLQQQLANWDGRISVNSGTNSSIKGNGVATAAGERAGRTRAMMMVDEKHPFPGMQ